MKNLNDINIESVFIVQALGTIRNDDMSCLLKDRYIALLESNITNGVFKSIKNFSNELNNIKSIDNLTKNSNDLSNVLLLRKLSQIANGRYNTKSFFEYLCLSSGYIDAMNTIYTNWESVKNLFIKVIISQNLKLIPKIKQELHVIANLENDLCHTIIKEEKNRYANN